MVAQAETSDNRRAIALFAFAAFVSALLAVISLNKMKDAAIALSLVGERMSLPPLLRALGPFDVALAVLTVASVMALALHEWRRNGFSLLLATATPLQAFAVLTVLAAWFGQSYLGAGVLLGGDTGTHVARFMEVRRGLENGSLPLWSNYQYTGAPLLWFTGPLSYVVGGVLAFLLQDAVLATKLFLFTLHIGSAWACFVFLRRLGIRPVPAMIVAAAFAGSFGHLHLFLYRGVFPQAITLVALVVLFYAADGLLRRRGRRAANMVVFALTTACLIVNHQPHALFAAFYLAIFGSILLVLRFWQWRDLPLLVLAGVLGAIAGAIAVVPTIVEADWVMLEADSGLFRLQLPTLERIGHLLLWRNTRTTWGIDYWAYLGLGMIVLAANGIVAMLRGRLSSDHRALAIAASGSLVVCLFVYNPVVRDVMFLLLFGGILAAIGWDSLSDAAWLSDRRRLIVVTVVMLDLLSTSIQPITRTDKSFLIDIGLTLERIAPHQRVVEVAIDRNGKLAIDMGPDGSPASAYATYQRVAGNHNMAATRVHNYLLTALALAQHDLQTNRRLSPRAETLLATMNVGRVICHASSANGCPADFSTARNEPVLGRTVIIAGATPVVFSRHLLALASPTGAEKPMLWPWDFEESAKSDQILAISEFFAKLVDRQGFDPVTATAKAIAVGSDQRLPPLLADNSNWRPTLRDYQVGLDRVTLRIESDRGGFAALAHPWFPSLVVTVNGRIIHPIRSTIGMIVIAIEPGISDVSFEDGWTTVRKLAVWISLIGLLAIAMVAAGLTWVDRYKSK